MHVVYSPIHWEHRPQHQFAGGRQVAHADAPDRAEVILEAVRAAGLEVIEPAAHDRDALLAVHAPDYVDYLEAAYRSWVAAGRDGNGVIPGTFPVRPSGGRPSEPWRLAGYYGIDTETVIGEHTFRAAVAAADCALTAADLLAAGALVAYALCRPPGHHAGRDWCGGYCYLNNAALAAARLTRESDCKVAILDLDAHHGNGTQDVFYESGEVLYVSIHADPAGAYPYYWGYAQETGHGPGAGCNLNLPLPCDADDGSYLMALDTALEAVSAFGPQRLVVSLGTDAVESDRLGPISISEPAFGEMGRRVADLGLPTLTVQEGGYDLGSIGRCVVGFLQGLIRS